MNTIAEVAAFTKVSTRTVQRAIADGQLQALHAGAGIRVSERGGWDWLRRSR